MKVRLPLILNLILLCTTILLTGCGIARTGIERPPPVERAPAGGADDLDRFETGSMIHEGVASWYGPDFQGKLTANGEIYNMNDLTAAHRTLPFNTIVEVTNLANGKSVRVRINDRGPYVGNRIIDLSRKAADEIDMINSGLGNVSIHLVEEGDRAITRTIAENRESFTVQLASFDSRELAQMEVQNITGAEVVRVQHAGEIYYRVYYGSFDQAEDAERQLRQLRRQGHSGFVKQREN